MVCFSFQFKCCNIYCYNIYLYPNSKMNQTLKNLISMKKSIAPIILLLSTGAAAVAQTWKIDPTHSKIGFTAKYLVISDVDGEFKDFNGTVTASNADWSDLSINAQVNVNSINTDNEMRDKHLKSDDFFNAEKFPFILFKSTGIKPLGNNKFVLRGDLTIRDVTRHVEWPMTYGGTVKDPWGNIKAGFKISASINRQEYGLKYTGAAATGEAVVSDNIDFTINTILVKQPNN